MKFLVVTHVTHKKTADGYYAAYGPYVKEMNLWFKNVDDITIIAPFSDSTPDKIDLPYNRHIKLIQVPEINLTTIPTLAKSFLHMPATFLKIASGIAHTDHLHLRCPGNMGLLGCVAQIMFPGKRKTAKYAGNWDKNSGQPFTYRLQRRLLNSELLTKNMQVMVYGNWPDSSPRNIKPFFTASYTNAQRNTITPRLLNTGDEIRLMYTGALIASKRPLLSIEIAQQLLATGLKVRLDMFGNGPLMSELQDFVRENKLDNNVVLHGNQPGETVKNYYSNAHFLIFLSRTEGWPKVVAEAMWWGCLPVTTAVSCVPEMVGQGTRGSIITADKETACERIRYYLDHPNEYEKQVAAASGWSQQFTLEKFEEAISQLLN